MQARKPEAKIARVEALEDSCMRAAQDESAAGLKHAPDFAESRAAGRLRDVLEDLDTGDVVKGAIAEGQQRTVALP